MEDIILYPIGIINTPYKSLKNIPIQGRFKDSVEGCCVLHNKYSDGLLHLDGFSHAILIYHFHKSTKEEIKSKPFLESVEHGIFAIRSPHRPNKIGFSVVKIKNIIKNKLFFSQVDIFDGTPLLDIKPFIKHFDNRENVKSGWVDKHFANGNIPDETILNKQ
ncbi:MAG: tRNA (N6-threonylcarbamoyladenosine(37)-N6)-methyltransferase TrmO [Prolixibacteraceae bacterium]|jgi:tRNA (adenine37-N6)-methyltransferase|nr:tRNA (N6-threonylcarbamoyladenosine(37)-N6)-methyltransferase TrmO [Prolixibacteraceae bacterium]MBT6005860.1 tRNA (N6-threonylcarbamoyladenosine(37)-N6)-methyltransferase TrmO [Prolixibacteraceae bacterium]MBT6764546.1 tRNA (N6-threonylcarbamoyladenosine(37)-N6)-methyltransferase TrmO [Prolixibacteraceae bacterium]MBT6996803.1 tRNA (N6-threonylcarbamoyladenosine(37)-N6)-methyltransferase TrmO [Prolixibacteraceae bacterium]MBT7393793.1 tRNA (N6-threonylcarbamoyladenosine(37)-N6)-methyltransf